MPAKKKVGRPKGSGKKKVGMGRKKKVAKKGGARKPRVAKKGGRKMKGDGFFGDLWSGVKSVANKVVSVAKPVHDFVKKNKIVSNVLKYVPDSRAKAAGEVADRLGYGKKGGAYNRPKGQAAIVPQVVQAGGSLRGRLYLN